MTAAIHCRRRRAQVEFASTRGAKRTDIGTRADPVRENAEIDREHAQELQDESAERLPSREIHGLRGCESRSTKLGGKARSSLGDKNYAGGFSLPQLLPETHGPGPWGPSSLFDATPPTQQYPLLAAFARIAFLVPQAPPG